MSVHLGVFPDVSGKHEAFAVGTPELARRRNGKTSKGERPLIARDEEVKLVQRIFLLSGPDVFRTVVFCGVAQEDGAELICASAGSTLAAKVDKPVCIVDADLRTGGLHKYFGVSNDKGLTEALRNFEPVRNYVQPLAIPNLWLMPCRQASAGSHISLPPDRLSQRLRELRTEFEYVLIHVPPASVSSDATLLGRLADGLVLVIGANSTHRETARKAKANLQCGNVTILGAVLNKRTFPIPQALYRIL